MPEQDWGFTYYKPTYVASAGMSQYRAKFVKPLPDGRLETHVTFFSNHPLRALRSMLDRLRSGNVAHPADFRGRRFSLTSGKAILMGD